MFNNIYPVKLFNKFDNITKFRLINSFFVSVGLSLIGPVIVILKGTLLLTWIVSMFAIMNMLAVKTNNYFVNNYNMSELYKIGVIVHICLIIASALYFINPIIMIWLDSIIVIIEVAIFSSYSILLNNYLAETHPKDMKDFQIIKNNTFAEGSLIGLSITTLITFFLPLEYAIVFFIFYNIIFSIWMLINWNFYIKENKWE